jgi:phosphoribosylformylglycinamidine (FGAM) synthase PurS component
MLQPHNHIKSFQSIYSLRTHKFIKLEMEKEEFFEQLTRKLQSELSQEEL